MATYNFAFIEVQVQRPSGTPVQGLPGYGALYAGAVDHSDHHDYREPLKSTFAQTVPEGASGAIWMDRISVSSIVTVSPASRLKRYYKIWEKL
jgi:hypothetical protein